MNGLREKGYLDDKAIHMTINLIDSQNESDQIKMIVNDSQNDDRNKINNKISNNDNNFLNINVEKVDDQPKEEKFVF